MSSFAFVSEAVEYGGEPLSLGRAEIDPVQSLRDPCEVWTQFLFEGVRLGEEFVYCLRIVFLLGLLHLVLEFVHIAIGLELGLIATDIACTSFCTSSIVGLGA
jgi:hypothetical protein